MKLIAYPVLLLWLLSTPLALPATESPRHGGRVVFGIRNDITSLNPFLRNNSTNYYVRGLTYV